MASKEPKIVIVDDSEFTRQSISDILTDEGFDVVGQASSAEAAVKLSGGEVNIYIIDVVMPQISGFEVASLLTEKNPDLKIIMMSSLRTESIIVESISNGAVDFIQKPFSRETLVQSVKKIERLLKDDKWVWFLHQ